MPTYDPSLSASFRNAAQDGDDQAVSNLLKRAMRNDNLGIDVKISFDLAAMNGHIKVLQLLFGHLSNQNDAIHGLFEACRYGQYLTVEWLLNRKSLHLSNETMMIAIRTAGINQHWSVMKLLMDRMQLYIADRQHVTTEHMDTLVVRSLRFSARTENVKIPEGSFIPKPIMALPKRGHKTV